MITSHNWLSTRRGKHRASRGPTRLKLDKDHLIAAIVLLVFVVLAGLSIWLGRLTDVEPELTNHYWPLLP